MVTRSIIKDTIEALEDMVDYLGLTDDPNAKERAGEIETLINFWRLYLNFMPKEDETHVG